MQKVRWTVAITALVAHFAFAQTPATGELTLAQALAMANRNSPVVSAALHEVAAQDGVVRQAGAVPNPELAASIEGNTSTTIQVNQSIELGNKRGGRVSVASHLREKSVAELAVVRADLRAAVVTAFYHVLSAQEGQRLAQDTLDLALRTTGAAAKRVAAGKVSPVEETKARIADAGIRVELAQANAELLSARMLLAATWGASSPGFERAAGQLASLPALPPVAQLLVRLDQSPLLVQHRAETERRTAMTRYERTRQIPDLTISVGAKRDRQLGRDQAIFGVSVPLPLFDTNQGSVMEATSREARARGELTAARSLAASALMLAHARWDTARQEVELYEREILPGAQSAYDAAAKGFEFGKFAFLDVLDAQRTLVQARKNHLRAQAETYKAAAEAERILGTPIQNQHQEIK